MNNTSHNPFNKIKFLLVNGFIFLLSVVMIQACNDDDDNPTSPPDETGNIAEVASSNDNFSDLVSALSDAGLVSTLEGDGPFTVFAPTNEAFANLSVDLSTLSNDQLVEVLSYHVVGDEIASGDLGAEQGAISLTGETLYVTVADGNVTVNDNAMVVDADIEASNGIIHAIDQVLLPNAFLDVVGIVSKNYDLQTLEDAVVQAELVSTLQEDTENGYTVFAPANSAFEGVDLSGLSQQELQDILTYHVVPQQYLSGDLAASQVVQTVNGEDLLIEVADGTVTITDNSGQMYQVTDADLQGSNGVVHIIDGVLNPNPNIVDVASEAGNFTTLVSALQDAGLVSTLEGAGPFTVFAPTDDAFQGVDLSGLSTEQLQEILSYHVIPANIASGDLEAQQAVDAVAGGQLFVEADGDVVVNDAATVVTADIGASNGTIHAIDGVLLPDAYQDIVGVVSKRYMLQTLEDAVVQADLVSTLQQDTQDGYTVFAPSNSAFEGVDLSGLSQQELQNILTYHVLPVEVLSGDITEGSVETVNGATIDIAVDGEGNVTLTDQAGNISTVTTVDLQGTNGVVHIIDGVLSPTQ